MTVALDLTRAHKGISDRQHRAGKEFGGDGLAATSSLKHRRYDREPAGSRGGTFEMGGIARDRFHRACKALGELRHVAIAVCVDDKAASAWAVEVGRKREDGLPLLRLALDVLAAYYAIANDAA